MKIKRMSLNLLLFIAISSTLILHSYAQIGDNNNEEFCTAYKYAYQRTRNEILDKKIQASEFLGMSTMPGVGSTARKNAERARREKSRTITLYCPSKPKFSEDYSVVEQGWLAGFYDANKDTN